jgi:hypothetical protein
LLNRVESGARRGKALDCRYLVAFSLDGEHQARPDRSSVEEHSAAPAHSVLAADMGAGQAQVVTQVVREQPARISRRLVHHPVDPHAAKALWVRTLTR